MTFADAFRKAAVKKGQKVDIPDTFSPSEVYPEQVPMMYRAQIRGRCSLQFASNNQDLKDWTQEWVYPNQEGQPTYQRSLPAESLTDSMYRFKLKFSFRVCNNCGQDTIIRPLIGKNGIPLIPGSSIKGLFERLSRSHPDEELRAKVKEYCGSQEHPGTLRFHGAYPIGDWAGTNKVEFSQNGENVSETRYRMVDIVHPQQDRQVKGTGKSTALALITLYQPILMFELSSFKPLSEEDWKTIKGLLRRALRQGLGGKTSTGYGLWFMPKDEYALNIALKGVGVSSLLRNNEPEFRPNLFKATLRGHVSRLLGGICNEPSTVKKQADRLFGHTTAPGVADIYWAAKPEAWDDDFQGIEKTPTYKTQGELHVDARIEQVKESLSVHKKEQKQGEAKEQQVKDQLFLKSVIQFAYTMGGFGKSWRRVWHKGSKQDWHTGFFPTYTTRAIGCHWEMLYSKPKLTSIRDKDTLELFLIELHNIAKDYMKLAQAMPCDWREAWHPSCVAVYCKAVSQSAIIDLFHQPADHPFKTTAAICGKRQVTKKVTRDGKAVEETQVEFAFSSIWHRMLPIENGQYLEIVTIFHGDRTPWIRNDVNQLPTFINALEQKGLELVWGDDPTSNET